MSKPRQTRVLNRVGTLWLKWPNDRDVPVDAVEDYILSQMYGKRGVSNVRVEATVTHELSFTRSIPAPRELRAYVTYRGRHALHRVLDEAVLDAFIALLAESA